MFWLLLGWGMWTITVAGENNDTVVTNKLSSKEFNDIFHDLLVERTTLLNTHLTNLYDNRDTSSTDEKLNANTKQLINLIEIVSNKDDKDMLIAVLQKQLENSELYVTGLQENDSNKLELSEQLLEADVTDFGKIIHKILPSISQSYAREWLKEQNILTVALINSYVTNNRTQQFDLLKDSYNKTNNMADQMVNAVQEKQQQNK